MKVSRTQASQSAYRVNISHGMYDLFMNGGFENAICPIKTHTSGNSLKENLNLSLIDSDICSKCK